MRIISSILFLFLLTNICAQENFNSLELSDDLTNSIRQKTQSINSIKSDFTQIKVLSMLEESLRSDGNFLYKKENKIKWKYQSPFKYTIVIDDGKFQINNEGKLSEFDINSNEMFKQINKMIVTAISGDFIDNPKFELSFFENDEYYMADLKPTELFVADMLSSIQVYFDKQNFTVEKIKFLEPGDDFTLISFQNRLENVNIEDTEFNIQ